MTDTTRTSGTDHHDVTETPGHPGGDGLIKPEYDDRLANSDLVPLKKQTWLLERRSPRISDLDTDLELATDGVGQ